MNDTVLTCPHCQGQFPLTETLAQPLVQAARARAAEANAARDAELARRESELRDRESRLRTERDHLQEQLQARLAEVLPQLRATEHQKAAAGVATELQALREELGEKKRALVEANAQELELRKQRCALEQKQQELELTVQRTLDAERERIRQAACADVAEAHRLELAEKVAVIAAMKKDLEKAQRTSEQASQQRQGEVMEVDLATVIGHAFPRDEFVRTPKGHNGADVLQRVKDGRAQDCGAILWECKRTKCWNDTWLTKLRDDQRAEHADLAVIVSLAMPDGIQHFGERDGVWIASPAFAPHLAALLRAQLLQVAQARSAIVGQREKASLLYEYLTGPQFRQRVQAILESFTEMQADLEAEKRQFTTRWHKREKQIARMLTNTCGLYGDVQGVSGAALPELPALPEVRGDGTSAPAA